MPGRRARDLMRTRLRRTIPLVAALALLATACGSGHPRSASSPPPATHEGVAGPVNAYPGDTGVVPQERGTDTRPPASEPIASVPPPTVVTPAGSGPNTLVLYDDGGTWGYLGELYAIMTGNLASHFGGWAVEPVARYQPGQLGQYTATIYIGSTFDQPLPVAFLDDVLASTSPVIWIRDNIWQLANRAPTFAATYGFDPWAFDTSTVTGVTYKGTTLTRAASSNPGIMTYSVLDPTRAQVLADAITADGGRFPWAVRSGTLTYLGENPFTYIDETDRYLVFCDLLFDALAPATAERHRALVRIEDVNATDDPAALRAIADYLEAEHVPFSVAVIPRYVDPLDAYGLGAELRFEDAPEFVAALEYMTSRGGTLLLHGFTHQHSNALNPYSGASADDFEFWTAHIDAQDDVVLDGPIPDDSASYAAGRVERGLQDFAAVGLPAPGIFEFPHYAGSAVDARTIATRFATAYHRGLYFGGALTQGPDDLSHVAGQFFPYAVHDVYGWKVLPENLGNYEPLPQNNHPPRLPADLLRNANAARVVRDGFASFYFHPYYPLSVLKQIVGDLEAAGYTFVGPDAN